MLASAIHIIRQNPRRFPGRRLTTVLWLAVLSCSTPQNPSPGGELRISDSQDHALVLALAVLGEDPDGKPKPSPARMVILERTGDAWHSRFIEDPTGTTFHKAMAYKPAQGPGGVLTLSGAAAAVKHWAPGKPAETLWEADFGGKFSRMRDAEVGDIYARIFNLMFDIPTFQRP